MGGDSVLKLLVVMDGLGEVKAGMDSSAAIAGEAFGRGHAVDLCTGEQLSLAAGAPVAPVRPVTAIGESELPVLGPSRPEQPLSSYDVVLMRKDPPFDRVYFFQTLLLERARADCLIVNDPRGLRDANEKLAILDYPDLIPNTRVTRSIAELHDFLDLCDGDIVVKPLDGYSGHGVLRVLATDQNRDALLELATDDGTRLTMAQSYIEGAEEGDKRILMLDGEPVGSFVRRPAPGRLRGNTRVGATLHSAPLTAQDKLICTRVGPALRAQGLSFVGVDVVGGLLTELNVTSPGGIRELTKVTGERVERLVVDWLERAVAEGGHRA